MTERVAIEEFLKQMENVPVLDVRSPGEFESGHIPGAISFPLFSDQERAEIGTLYKQVGKETATTRGLELVEPRMKEIFNKGLLLAKNNKMLVHCWRGGKRSESVAWLLSLSGIEVCVLEGGYKFYRRWAEQEFEKKVDLIILGGRTGSGKTEVLQELKKQGEQILDLEKMADHKGSAFGRLGATREVTQAQFENDLAMAIYHLKPGRVWVEDESRGIGRQVIPGTFWQQMRNTRVCYIDIPKSERVNLLDRIYGSYSKEELASCIVKVKDQLGGLRTQEALVFLQSGDTKSVVGILLDYYDKTYDHGLSKRDQALVERIPFKEFDAARIAENLIRRMNNK